jgi:protein-tyrosine phosphatase
MENIDRLHRLVLLGALAQVTGGSVLGQFGQRSQQVSHAMIRRNLAHIVASDAHDPSYRRPVLSEAAAEVARLFGPERSRAMVEDLPRAIVRGEPIDPPEPVEQPAGLRGFLSGWFGRRSQPG